MSSDSPNSSSSEQGDYIINWHLSYCADLMLQGEGYLHTLMDLIKAELIKIKTDSHFILEELPGPHTHISKLKSEDKDLRRILPQIKALADDMRLVAKRAQDRLI